MQVVLQIWTWALALITPPSIPQLSQTDSCLPSPAYCECREACDTACQHVPNPSIQSFSTLSHENHQKALITNKPVSTD